MSTTTVRPDLAVFESDASPGEVALVVMYRGRRVMRVEIAAEFYFAELGQIMLRRIESMLPPFLTLHRDGASSRSRAG